MTGATTTATASLTAELAAYCVRSREHAVPQAAAEMARWVLLDDLGCMLLGTTLPVGRLILGHVSSLRSQGDVTIVGTQSSVAAPLAALANGMANHADELDGTHITEGHPSAIITPATLAMAEHVSASGADLVRAMVLAYDVGTRLVRAIGGRLTALSELHWHSDLCHVIGATAGVGQLVGLTEQQLRYAFALAAHQVSMPGAFFDEPDHLTKALNCGQGAYAAVSGVLMAAEGFTANAGILEDPHGLLHAWSLRPDFDEVLEGLGDYSAIVDCNFKVYSAGYPIHAPVHAALRLLNREGIAFDELDRVEVHMTTNSAQLVDDRAMKSISVQDMLSLAMYLGRLDVDAVHPETEVVIPEVEAFRDRVTVVRDAELDRENPDGRGAWILVTTKDGRTLREVQPFPPWHSRARDASWEGLAGKFSELAGRVLDEETISKAIETIGAIGDVPDVHELTRLVK